MEFALITLDNYQKPFLVSIVTEVFKPKTDEKGSLFKVIFTNGYCGGGLYERARSVEHSRKRSATVYRHYIFYNSYKITLYF